MGRCSGYSLTRTIATTRGMTSQNDSDYARTTHRPRSTDSSVSRLVVGRRNELAGEGHSCSVAECNWVHVLAEPFCETSVSRVFLFLHLFYLCSRLDTPVKSWPPYGDRLAHLRCLFVRGRNGIKDFSNSRRGLMI